MSLPEDIYTEPEDVSPDTLANLGPLARLAGEWQSDAGVDIAPKAEGPDRRAFIEHVRMDPIDPQANGPQLLYGLRYHVHITTAEELSTFHDQVGYWLYEPATGLIMQSIAIPRGQVVLAGGKASADGKSITVEAKRGDTRFEATAEAEARWTAHVVSMYSMMLMRKAKGWFTGYNSNVAGHEEGKVRYFVYNGGAPKYVERITSVAEKGYEGVVLQGARQTAAAE